MPLLRHVLPSALLATSALSAADKVTFDDHIFPLFQQACLNCHNPDKAKGGLDLSTYTGTLKGGSGGKIVEPGDPGSTLINLVKQTAEPFMPPEGDKLDAGKIALLTQWIEGGLLENKSSSARKPSKPKFEAAMRSDPSAKPDGPPPMPGHVLLEPAVVTVRASVIHGLAASPWAPLLAVTGQRQVLLHHTGTLELVGILPFPEGDPISLAFTPDGRYLIVGGGIPGKSGVTVTFDVTTGERTLSAGREFDAVLAADIRPGFDIVATGGPSRLLKLWNTSTGEQIQSIKKHTEWITALDISPDGVLLASGDRNGGVWVWESDTGNEFHTLRAHQAAITATVFRADSNLLSTASEDGTVRYWEMNNGNEVRKNDAHPGGVTALAFARDGSSLTAGRDRKARLWKPDFSPAKEIAAKLPALPTAVALDADGKRAFIGDAAGLVHAFDAADAKRIGEIAGNPPTIAARLEAIDAALRDAPQPPPALQESRKHWAAAAINTRALTARRLAEQADLDAQEQADTFATALAQLAPAAEALKAKRAERAEFAKSLLAANRTPEVHAEVEATVAALDQAIADHLARLRELEAAAIRERHAAESALPAAYQQATAANQLREDYLQALK